MTDQPFQPPVEAPEPPPVAVDAASDPELAFLHQQYAELKPAAEEAAEKLDAVKQAIKAKLNGLDPNARKFGLSGEGAPTLTLTYSEGRRFDSRRFRRDHPDAYENYLGAPTGSWTLREA